MMRQHPHRTARHKVLARLAALEIRVIDEYRRSAGITLRSDERWFHKSLENTRRKVESGERSAEELEGKAAELDMARRIHGLSEELAVIALFRVLELGY